MQLRDYQEQIVTSNLDAKSRGVGATLNGLFTGAGKTVIFCTMASRMPGRTLIAVPLRELAWQTVDKVRDVAGLDPGLEMGEFRSDEGDWWSPKVVVASKQTLLRKRCGEYRYTKFRDISLVIADEAHLMCSEPCIAMFRHFQSLGAMVAGFTATPFRMDGKAMMKVAQ